MQKHIYFNGQKLTLFSLDGITWSSRKTELPQIKERQNAIKEKIRSNFIEEPATEVEAVDEKGTERPAPDIKAKPVPKKRISQLPQKKSKKKGGRKAA